MNPRRPLAIWTTAVLCLGIAVVGAFAQAQFGTEAEAQAMLERAVAALKVDKANALEMFNNGEGGFKDRDLQPFCFNVTDGKITSATVPALLGTDIRALKDKTGRSYGQEVYDSATEGRIARVTYMFPRPGGDATLYQKTSLVTRVSDQGCGVGYFK